MMVDILKHGLAISAILAYGISAWLRLHTPSIEAQIYKKFTVEWFALTTHTFFLYLLVETKLGQNLSLVNSFAQVVWGSVLISMWLSRYYVLQGLSCMIYLMAALSLILSYVFPMMNIIDTKLYPNELFHIVLAFMMLAVFVVTLFFALSIFLQNKWLKGRKIYWISFFPPMDTQEKLFFLTLRIGFLLLSVLLITSLWSLSINTTEHLVQNKMLVTLLSWLLLGTLIWGHQKYGWRGTIAIKITLAGVSLVFLMLLICYNLWKH